MKFKNTTKLNSQFLRRLLTWAAKQCDPPVKLSTMRSVEFLNWSGFRGTAWRSRRIIVRVGQRPRNYPHTWRYKKRSVEITYHSATEELVSLVIHELQHIADFSLNRKTNEHRNERIALAGLTKFRDQQNELLASWLTRPESVEIAKPSVVDLRAVKAERDLARWERKLKLAKTKVAKLKKKVNYYGRRAARSN